MIARGENRRDLAALEDLRAVGLEAELAHTIAERVRSSIESSPVDIGETRLPVLVSVGVAVADLATDDADHVLRSADLAMYARKQQRAAAARATATSPSGWTACTPVGEMTTGIAISWPITVVLRSRFSVAPVTCRTNPISPNASTLSE